MKRRWIGGLAAAWMLALGLCAASAQDRGYWVPANDTAKDITGDIAISEMKLTIDFSRFTIAQIRQLTPAEAAATFGDGVGAGGGNLYRLDVPAEKKFAHHNTLCGEQETQWMATWSNGRRLSVAFFSGSDMPVLTAAALAQSQNVCELLEYGQ